jgi:hypothetical protein
MVKVNQKHHGKGTRTHTHTHKKKKTNNNGNPMAFNSKPHLLPCMKTNS